MNTESAGSVALILHAHLPWVRHPEHRTPLEERWLHEALWECYLPLCELLDRLANDGVPAGLSISISPPLAAMLRDPLLRDRFEDHLARLMRLADRLSRSFAMPSETRSLMPFYVERLAEAHATWDRIDRDVLGALVAHHEAGRIELMTTSATHAYLPGLLSEPSSVRAQLRLGLRAFEAFSGVKPRGLWLPECGYDPRLADDLARAGVAYTVLDAHGLTLARPKPTTTERPILGRTGVAFFGRDPEATYDVWSRRGGYPGDPSYRDFYRDVGFDLPEQELAGELGPNGTRLMTGLKPYRITGETAHKEPYEPKLAAAQARVHAKHFVAKRQTIADPTHVLVAPFDAELFGHWWFEGPIFLEAVLRELAVARLRGGVGAVTLGEHLTRYPDLVRSEPAASSWGEGGFGAVWAGPEAARLWRHVHHAEHAVREAVARARGATGERGQALDQAIRELCLLQASDWAFMIQRGDMVPYAEARVRAHAHRATRLAAIAASGSVSPEDARWVEQTQRSTPFLHQLSGEHIQDAFDDL